MDNGYTQRVGVFVDAPLTLLKQKITTYQLHAVQLHGTEPPELCEALKRFGVDVFKAFSVDTTFNWSKVKTYNSCDYFIFDTKGKHPGGNGSVFDWNLLHSYEGNTPFLLSGGIDPSHSDALNKIAQIHPAIAGLDINSKFEIQPGIKNTEHVTSMANAIKNYKHVSH